ncbi:SHOCT domain-containing protein [Lactococcus garvieae]|uniref:SHOCT domain-containing protein n=1 Tax=Lactococcus garvieae TaxID=1363 RepID=UPI0038533DBF
MNQETIEKKVFQIEDKTEIVSSSDTNTFEQYQTDFIYQCVIIQLKKLLENTLISVDEYRQMEQEIRQELCPYLHELYPS